MLSPFVKRLGLPELVVGGGLGVAYVEGEEAADAFAVGARAARGRRTALGVTCPRRRRAGAVDRRVRGGDALHASAPSSSCPASAPIVAVDGGMSDNPRPVLYGSGYEAFLPRATNAGRPQVVRIVGKHCESGDVLVHDAHVPDDLAVGDVLCHARHRGLRALDGIELQQGPAPRRGVRS